MTEKHLPFLMLITFLMGMALPAPASATELYLSLKTNYRPGIDFIAVRTTMTKPDGVVVRQPVEKSVFTTSDTDNEYRIAKFDLPNGSYVWIVRLLDQNETAIEERRSQFELGSLPLGDIALITTPTLPATCSTNLAATESKLLACKEELEATQNNLDATCLPAGCPGSVCPPKCPQQAVCPPKCPQQAVCPPKCHQQAVCPPKCHQQAVCECPPGPQGPADTPKPDLVPSNPQPGAGEFGFCRFDASGKNLIVTIKNQGATAAEPSQTEVKFKDEEPVTQSTPAIPAGGSIDVLFERPPSCKIPGCKFEIRVDSERSVDEADETNNVATGLCLG